jgi:hypothetical protein
LKIRYDIDGAGSIPWMPFAKRKLQQLAEQARAWRLPVHSKFFQIDASTSIYVVIEADGSGFARIRTGRGEWLLMPRLEQPASKGGLVVRAFADEWRKATNTLVPITKYQRAAGYGGSVGRPEYNVLRAIDGSGFLQYVAGAPAGKPGLAGKFTNRAGTAYVDPVRAYYVVPDGVDFSAAVPFGFILAGGTGQQYIPGPLDPQEIQDAHAGGDAILSDYAYYDVQGSVQEGAFVEESRTLICPETSGTLASNGSQWVWEVDTALLVTYVENALRVVKFVGSTVGPSYITPLPPPPGELRFSWRGPLEASDIVPGTVWCKAPSILAYSTATDLVVFRADLADIVSFDDVVRHDVIFVVSGAGIEILRHVSSLTNVLGSDWMLRPGGDLAAPSSVLAQRPLVSSTFGEGLSGWYTPGRLWPTPQQSTLLARNAPETYAPQFSFYGSVTGDVLASGAHIFSVSVAEKEFAGQAEVTPPNLLVAPDGFRAALIKRFIELAEELPASAARTTMLADLRADNLAEYAIGV